MSNNKAAKSIGDFFPEIKDKLLNTIQLNASAKKEGTLILAGLNQRGIELNHYKFSDAVQYSQNRRYFKYIILPTAGIFLMLIFNASMLMDATKRLVNFDKQYAIPAPFKFNITNKNLSAFYNEDYTLNVKLSGSNVPNLIFIESNGIRKTLTKNSKNSFSYTFNNIKNDLRFIISSGAFHSDEHTIKLKHRPELLNLNALLNFPSYLNRNPDRLANAGNLVVPEGTVIQWDAKSTNTREINWLFTRDQETINIKPDKNGLFSVTKTFKKSSNYSLRLNNAHGKNKNKLAFEIEIIKDKYPKIQVKNSIDSNLYQHILIGGYASDDYGIIRANATLEISNQEGSSVKTIKTPLNIKKGRKEQNLFYQINLDTFNVAPGSIIEYFVEVYDNDGVNGSKRSKSQIFSFKIPTAKEIKEDIKKTNSDSEKSFESSKSQASKTKSQLDKLADRIKSKKQLSWEDKKLLEDIIKEKKKLQENIEQNKNQLKNNLNKIERFSKSNEKIKEKINALNELMENILDEKTKKIYDELNKLLQEDSNLDKIQKTLDKIKNKDETLEKEIDRALEMFKNLQFEQKLDENISKLEKLSKKQKKLSKETKNKSNDNQSLKKEQDQLNKEFQDVKKSLEELKSLNDELKNKKKLNNFKVETQDIQQEIKNSKESLENGRRKKAGDSQQKAGEKMEDLKNKLSQMQSSGEMEQSSENIESLRSLLENLMHLSFSQEELMVSFKNIRQSDPRFIDLSQEQLKLGDDSKVIEDSLYALAERVHQIKSFVTKEVTKMNHQMELSTEQIKKRLPRKAAAQQQYALTSINNLSLMLSEVLDQLQQQMAQEMPGNQMCSKPGKGKPSKPSLSQMQKELNEMLKQMKEGNSPGGRKMSEQLAKMAAQQEMIRQAIKQMAAQMQKDGKNPGDGLSKLMQEMKKTEEDIVNKNITSQTIERQKKIMTRLLEAEKAKKERDWEKKRESKTGDQIKNQTPKSFDDYIKEKEKQTDLLKSIPLDLLPYYKEKVSEYFQNIEN